MPRLIELILRRTTASISSPCSLNCATISRAWRSASGKFAISARPSSRNFASDSRARNRTRASESFIKNLLYQTGCRENLSLGWIRAANIVLRMRRLEREVLFLGQALADQSAQPRHVQARIAPRLGLRHLVGLFVYLRFGLEIRRHQLDYARDQVLHFAFGLDQAAIDKPLHQMGRQRVDLSLPHRHRSSLKFSALLVKTTPRVSRSMLRLLGVLFVLLFLVDLVHLQLECLVKFLDMRDVGAEVAREVAQHRGRIGARQPGARAHLDLA